MPTIKTHEKLRKNVNENFRIFLRIFMKFSAKFRTKKMRIIYTILSSFCSFLNWEGADMGPQIRPRKIPDYYIDYMFKMMSAYFE